MIVIRIALTQVIRPLVSVSDKKNLKFQITGGEFLMGFAKFNRVRCHLNNFSPLLFRDSVISLLSLHCWAMSQHFVAIWISAGNVSHRPVCWHSLLRQEYKFERKTSHCDAFQCDDCDAVELRPRRSSVMIPAVSAKRNLAAVASTRAGTWGLGPACKGLSSVLILCLILSRKNRLLLKSEGRPTSDL